MSHEDLWSKRKKHADRILAEQGWDGLAELCRILVLGPPLFDLIISL